MTDTEKTILIETEQRSKSNSHRIDGIDEDIKEIKNDNKAIYKIATSVEVIAEKIGTIEDKVDETKKRVDENAQAQQATEDRFLKRINDIENAPARKSADELNKVKMALYTSGATFLLTSILSYLLMRFTVVK